MLTRLYLTGFAGLFLLTTFLPTSCDPDYVGGSATTDVDGQIFLDGQPIENAKVVFMPYKSFDVEGRSLAFSYGTTDPQGKFVLKQANGNVGAARGLHRVIVSKKISQDENATLANENPLADILPAANQGLFSGPQNSELIPIIYNRQSTLTFDVNTSFQAVRAKFELTSVDPLLLDD